MGGVEESTRMDDTASPSSLRPLSPAHADLGYEEERSGGGDNENAAP
jgi:hypothetical protein